MEEQPSDSPGYPPYGICEELIVKPRINSKPCYEMKSVFTLLNPETSSGTKNFVEQYIKRSTSSSNIASSKFLNAVVEPIFEEVNFTTNQNEFNVLFENDDIEKMK